MTLPAWNAPKLEPVTNDRELNNVLAAMKRMGIFRPFELAAYLNAAIAEGRHARLLDVVGEFFATYTGAAPLDVETYINESVTKIRDVANASGARDFEFITVKDNILRVSPGDNFLYFVFISYVAHRRGVKVELTGAPTRTMQICFMNNLDLHEGEDDLLLVDLMRIRNRGLVHYPGRVGELKKREEKLKKDALTGNPY